MYYSSRGKFHECDLVLCPSELSSYGTFDTKHMAEIVEVGYRATRERMDDIVRVVAAGRPGEPH